MTRVFFRSTFKARLQETDCRAEGIGRKILEASGDFYQRPVRSAPADAQAFRPVVGTLEFFHRLRSARDFLFSAAEPGDV